MADINLIIPLDTQIVTRIEIKSAQGELLCPVGAVGVIVKAPTDNTQAYRVQFTSGVEAALRRNEFSIRKQHTSAPTAKEAAIDESELYDFVIYRVIVGSRAYGLDTAESDTDWRGIYLPPADLHWSMFGVPEQIENKDTEECYWELQRTNLLPSLAAIPPREGEAYMHAAPMFHLADFPALMSVTQHGCAHVMLKRFAPAAFLELVERERVGRVTLVPTMVNFIINHPDIKTRDVSSLKSITYGASPMPAELLKRAMHTLPNVEFYQGYGQSESSPLLTRLSPQDHVLEGPEHLTRRLASCGRPIVGVELDIFDENDQPVQPGEVGEIVARGPNVMLGYWKRPEETARTLRGGWLHTGDAARMDEYGFFYIVDRTKDMIVTGGENVYSTEVENVLFKHPAVREAAVIGTPDEKWGEVVAAIVTLKPDAEVTAEELIAHCAAHLAHYKTPKLVELKDGELPKGGTGKIDKKVLREPYWKGYTRRVN
jgi:acyl-CoA synthetase (AMP-forming)/AMP-acid ligase II